jgi:uroporphyrinogen-III synthase
MRRTELSGVSVLVTRPAGQTETLCQLIEQHGGTAIPFPLMVITPPSNPVLAQQQINPLATYDLVIFISANAVIQSWPLITQAGGIPNTVHVAAVGKATAKALLAHGQPVALMPTQDFSSEGLLALEALQSVTGKHVLIVRGEGGKETLARVLRTRGAAVEYAQVYRREPPQASLAAISINHATPPIDLITISSGEALHNLATLARQQQQEWVFSTTLVVAHPRHAAQATPLGFKLTPQIADNATDEAMVTAMCRWRQLHAASYHEGATP